MAVLAAKEWELSQSFRHQKKHRPLYLFFVSMVLDHFTYIVSHRLVNIRG
jgi:hypothetical protein